MFSISISIEDSKVVGMIEIDSYFFEPSKYDYAFYLYRNDERVDIKWYTSEINAIFNLESKNGVFYIKAFIRDIEQGNIRKFNSEKISIDS
ncbi:hypothetical protein [Psychrobacter sp.]|uniref:hypothetical protein n=1 Tax=unclassified Psychrobacter TaxID=196806 RepID=UPI000EE7B889|nr:hypothetical protein [Psychrobacter sp.]HCI77080.1 hypothetical protein [Psychrobacter sp.]